MMSSPESEIDWCDVMFEELSMKGLSPYDGTTDSIDIMCTHILAEIDREVVRRLVEKANANTRTGS
jgi:hypothetical protein